jgi:hypothetical protein
VRTRGGHNNNAQYLEGLDFRKRTCGDLGEGGLWTTACLWLTRCSKDLCLSLYLFTTIIINKLVIFFVTKEKINSHSFIARWTSRRKRIRCRKEAAHKLVRSPECKAHLRVKTLWAGPVSRMHGGALLSSTLQGRRRCSPFRR